MSTTATALPPRKRSRRAMLLASIFAVIGVGGGFFAITGQVPNPFQRGHAKVNGGEAAGRLQTVKVIHPKLAASVPITINNIANVEPYYQADLRARASGLVKKVHRDIGDKVKAGQVLIEIDVPEADHDVSRADAMVFQRQQELKVSEAKLKDAKALKDVSAATVKQRLADVDASAATRDLKKKRYDRFKDLAARGSVVATVVEEEERDYISSEAAVVSAKANVEKARADFAESESRVEAAAADIDLKKAQIVVAQKEVERAKSIADYSRVTAPFDGVVIRRNVDPGSFVQNSTSGASETLISVAKVDLVTVSSRFPDSIAPFMNIGVEAIVQVDDLPGVTIPARITRYSPAVNTVDRTMRVEIDLFNGTDDEYKQLEAQFQSRNQHTPIKGVNDTLPTRAFPSGTPETRRLLSGMSGTMTLKIGGFAESYVLPSSAIYSRSGTPYVLLVENGTTRQVQVRVQVNDGKSARVVLMEKRPLPGGKTQDLLVELTGQELVVASRQQDVGEGATVQPTVGEWER